MAVEKSARDVYTGHTIPVDLEPQIPTLKKKLIINVAPNGTFTTRANNPYQPYTPEEIAREVEACYREGASAWHVHCRDDDGVATKDPAVYKRTMDLVFEKCPDIITSVNVIADYAKHGRDMIAPLVEPLANWGRKYLQTVVVTASTVSPSPTFTLVANQVTMTSEVQYILEKGARPEFQLHGWTGAWNVINWLIKPGILPRPYIMNMVFGWHAYHDASPVQDPWAQLWMVSFMNSLPEGSVIGATAGGRNWLPLTTMAIMLGVDQVRIGMEDCVYMYPHRDEKIRSNADVVRKVATIARELGREIATPAEARKILGLAE